MQFIETRGNDGQKPSSVPFSEAILSPSASFGGLYVPSQLPTLDQQFWRIICTFTTSHFRSVFFRGTPFKPLQNTGIGFFTKLWDRY
jgi:threonine synthase